MRIQGIRSSSSTLRRIILQVVVASTLPFLAATSTVAASPHPGSCPGRLTDLQVSRADGLTRVILEFDDDIQPTCWRSFRLTDPDPREVLVLLGIGTKWEPATIEVDDPVVERIRTGLHPERSPSELHLVIDLSTADAKIMDARASGSLLVLLVGRPGSTALVTASPPSSPATATATPSPTPFAIVPSPTVTAVAMATREPATPPNQTPIPHGTPQPATVTEPTSAPGPAPVTAPQPLPAMPTSTPAPVDGTARPQIVQIVVTPRGTDGTLIRITADRSLPFGTHRLVSIDRDPPRAVLSLKGVEIGPGVERIQHFDDANVASVRLVAADDVAPHEVHLVLSLTDADVKLREIAARGEHLVISVERVTNSPEPQD